LPVHDLCFHAAFLSGQPFGFEQLSEHESGLSHHFEFQVILFSGSFIVQSKFRKPGVQTGTKETHL